MWVTGKTSTTISQEYSKFQHLTLIELSSSIPSDGERGFKSHSPHPYDCFIIIIMDLIMIAMTKLEISFEKGGTLTATLLEDKAPETCKAILEALSVTSEVLHAQYAGSEVYFEDFPARDDVPFENTTSRVDENMYLTNKHPGGVLAYYPNPKVKSFCIVYGEIVPRRLVDVEIPLNVFAEIDDKEKAVELGSRVRREGVEKVTVKAKK